jgi:hypothetical protein
MKNEIETVSSSVAEAFLEVLAYSNPYPGCESRLTEEHVQAAGEAFRETLSEYLGTELFRSDNLAVNEPPSGNY